MGPPADGGRRSPSTAIGQSGLAIRRGRWTVLSAPPQHPSQPGTTVDRLHLTQVGIGREPVFGQAHPQGEKPARRTGGAPQACETAPGLPLTQKLHAFPNALVDGSQRAALPTGPSRAARPAHGARADRTGSQVIPAMGDTTRVTDLAMRGAQTLPTFATDSLVGRAHDPAVQVATVRTPRAHQGRADVAGRQQSSPHRLPTGLAHPGATRAQPGLADGADASTASRAVCAVTFAADLAVGHTRPVFPTATGRLGTGGAQRTSAGPTRQAETSRALPPPAGATDLAVSTAVRAVFGAVIPTVRWAVAQGAQGQGLARTGGVGHHVEGPAPMVITNLAAQPRRAQQEPGELVRSDSHPASWQRKLRRALHPLGGRRVDQNRFAGQQLARKDQGGRGF